jgi:hypothetical protein
MLAVENVWRKRTLGQLVMELVDWSRNVVSWFKLLSVLSGSVTTFAKSFALSIDYNRIHFIFSFCQRRRAMRASLMFWLILLRQVCTVNRSCGYFTRTLPILDIVLNICIWLFFFSLLVLNTDTRNYSALLCRRCDLLVGRNYHFMQSL